MLEVELDIFSGMPNPAWILSEKEEKELIDRITSEPDQISPVHTLDEQLSQVTDYLREVATGGVA